MVLLKQGLPHLLAHIGSQISGGSWLNAQALLLLRDHNPWAGTLAPTQRENTGGLNGPFLSRDYGTH